MAIVANTKNNTRTRARTQARTQARSRTQARAALRMPLLACALTAMLTGCATMENPAMTELFSKTQAAGRYAGELLLRPLPNGRDMEIAKPFEYIDPQNVRWVVPEKTLVNGASIPKALWSTIGGPFSGRYRDASVIHDFHCEVRVRPAKQVHRAFLDAMLTSGVQKTKAKIMYYAVTRFGPSWKEVSRKQICDIPNNADKLGLTSTERKICEFRTRSLGKDASKAVTAKFNAQDFEAAKKLIAAGDLSTDDIEKMALKLRP